MRKIGKICQYILALFIFISCEQKQTASSVQIRKLNYPSASAIEYYKYHDPRLYIMGDDATKLLVLDTNFNILDTIHMITYSGRRIPKEIKPDLEASSLYIHGSNEVLLFLGSLSTPERNRFWEYDLKRRSVDSGSLDHLYPKIKRAAIEQVNIEGICIVFDDLVMSNRGNKSYPTNYLIIGPKDLWKTDTNYDVRAIPVITNVDTSVFAGISGLHYSEESDLLIMSVSTEDTRNTYEDGAIGKSYLWLVDSISHKLNADSIKPNKIIDLETIDPGFKGQKIESVTVIKETGNLIYLVLVADNDDGSSTVFKMRITRAISLTE